MVSMEMFAHVLRKLEGSIPVKEMCQQINIGHLLEDDTKNVHGHLSSYTVPGDSDLRS